MGARLLLLALLLPFSAAALELPLSGGESVTVAVRPAEGTRLLLWLPADRGLSPRRAETAAALGKLGLEVWEPDLHGAFFLAPGRNSLEPVPPAAVRELIEAARARTGKGVYLLASGHSAALALAGAHAWQTAHPDDPGLRGAVLLHPNLYAEVPEGAQAAAYLPIASATNLPLYLLQPANSAAHWHLEVLERTLRAGGAPVFAQTLEGVSDGFNERPDFNTAEAAATRRLPQLIRQASDLLEDYAGPRAPAPLPAAVAQKPPPKLLKPYTGTGPTPELALPDLQGADHRLAALKGEVVLVNFWATWCPPCVEELPSLQRLHERLSGRGLRILAVDVGEEAEAVGAFAAPFGLGFPVLLDAGGEALARWRVHAFPTNFIVDRAGTIRYAFFGALAWDDPQVVAPIAALLDEASPAP